MVVYDGAWKLVRTLPRDTRLLIEVRNSRDVDGDVRPIVEEGQVCLGCEFALVLVRRLTLDN